MKSPLPSQAPLPSALQRIGVFTMLAIAMLATRINHFGAFPDASWAIFFIAGFYFSAASIKDSNVVGDAVRGDLRWVFTALVVVAVGIDYAVITAQGISFWRHYCISPAYWFLLPSYAALSLGGAWLRRGYAGLEVREIGRLLASVLVATSLCYLISNGSFYWISANVPQRSFSGWMVNLGDWYLPYLRTTSIYVAIAAMLHVATALATRTLESDAHAAARL